MNIVKLQEWANRCDSEEEFDWFLADFEAGRIEEAQYLIMLWGSQKFGIPRPAAARKFINEPSRRKLEEMLERFPDANSCDELLAE